MASKFAPLVKKFIDQYYKKNFVSPSIRDIKNHLDKIPATGGNVSTNTVAYILENDLGFDRKKATEKGQARHFTPDWVKTAIKEAKIE